MTKALELVLARLEVEDLDVMPVKSIGDNLVAFE